MSWVAVKHNGAEVLFCNKPLRHKIAVLGEQDTFYWGTPIIEEDDVVFAILCVDCDDYEELGIKELGIPLPKGSIKKLIGRELTWEDEPVELIDKTE